MMNLTASHYTPRFSTVGYNPGRYKYRNTPREDSAYRIDRPDERTRRIQQLILVQQFTGVGAPHVWNGDEVGMWGADDPDERKPPRMAPTCDTTTRSPHPLGRPRRRDRVAPDTALFRVYHDLIALEEGHLRLFVDGTLRLAPNRRQRAACWRTSASLATRRAVVAFNNSDALRNISLPADGGYRLAFPAGGGGGSDRR